MGGARTGRPKARSVVVMVGWSNTTPTSFMRRPHLSPHFLKLSTSILKVRLRSCAQEMRFRLRDFWCLPEEPHTKAIDCDLQSGLQLLATDTLADLP